MLFFHLGDRLNTDGRHFGFRGGPFITVRDKRGEALRLILEQEAADRLFPDDSVERHALLWGGLASDDEGGSAIEELEIFCQTDLCQPLLEDRELLAQEIARKGKRDVLAQEDIAAEQRKESAAALEGLHVGFHLVAITCVLECEAWAGALCSHELFRCVILFGQRLSRCVDAQCHDLEHVLRIAGHEEQSTARLFGHDKGFTGGQRFEGDEVRWIDEDAWVWRNLEKALCTDGEVEALSDG